MIYYTALIDRTIMNLVTDTIRPIINTTFRVLFSFLPRKENQKKKLLVIKLEGLGDFIIFLPSLINYKKIFPDHTLTLLVDSTINYQIAKRYEGEIIDSIILLDSKKFSKNIFFRFTFAKLLYTSNFDITINPIYYRRKISDFLVRITASKMRIGFAGYEIEKRKKNFNTSKIYTDIISVPPSITNEFYRHKHLVETLYSHSVENYHPIFPMQESDRVAATTLLGTLGLSPHKYVAIFPGAGRAVSKWPPENFAKIIDYLQDKNIATVICGSAMEKLIAEKILDNVTPVYKSKIINLTGNTDIFTTAGIIQLSQLYVGNDSGPTHLAEAVGATIICPLGLGHFREFYPSEDTGKNIIIKANGLDCLNDAYACALHIDPSLPAPCVKAITPEQVLMEVKRHL